MVFKLEDSLGYNPLRIAQYERAVGVAESANDLGLRTFPDTFRGYNSRLAALLGLSYLVLDRPIPELPRHVPRPRGTLLFAGDHFFVYRLDQSLAARAYLATRLKPIDVDGTIDGGSLPTFMIGQEALIDQDELDLLKDKALVDVSAPIGGSKALITAYGSNRIAIDVDAAAAGLLVLHDIAYPGWDVSVDGVKAPLLRANLLFRGVEVPAGHHAVEFSFHPLSLANLAAAVGDLLHKDDK